MQLSADSTALNRWALSTKGLTSLEQLADAGPDVGLGALPKISLGPVYERPPGRDLSVQTLSSLLHHPDRIIRRDAIRSLARLGMSSPPRLLRTFSPDRAVAEVAEGFGLWHIKSRSRQRCA